MEINEYPKEAGIYKLTCNNNGKVYIGKSVNIRRRLQSHRGTKGGFYFQNAIIKHGWDSFEVEILEIVENFNKLCDNDKLLEREAYYIEFYDATNKDKGYNRCKFSADKTGTPMPENVREKLRLANVGRQFTEEHKYKIGSTWRGKKRPPFTKEHRDNISKSKLGIRLSEEHKKNIGKVNEGKIVSEETRKKMSESQTGKRRSQKTRDEMSRSRSGKPSTRIGYTHSEETKKKMREIKIGKPSNAKGHKHTEETKEKIRRSKAKFKLDKNQETTIIDTDTP